MFKKFKDKLAEEMKQSPARLQASMQQLAQAVVSPALSTSSIQELSPANDNFSLTEEGDETPKNSPLRHGFRSVDLTASNSIGASRRSSTGSVTSLDAASLFPIYENPGNMYHIQSDVEQSASEADENLSPQLERISKDQLYSAYRKVQSKYQKYRGRYTDLANHYREMERVKGKLESLLVETQDKALRRIADLKEQCQLEQQAKAHLEEALRNDIEEKDHVIETLNTKVMLLQTNSRSSEGTIPVALSSESQSSEVSEMLIDVSPEKSSDTDSTTVLLENSQLKTKIEKLETLLSKYKETLRRSKEKITELTEEKSKIEREFDTTQSNNSERFKELEDDLNVARREITNLREDIAGMRKREEESAISLAENKLTIHRELELKEEQIKELRKEMKIIESKDASITELQYRDERIEELEKQLALSEKNREDLERSVKHLSVELEERKEVTSDTEDSQSDEPEKNEKPEAFEAMRSQMMKKVTEIEERLGAKRHDKKTKIYQLAEKLERREEDIKSFEREIAELRKESDDYREKCQELRNELSMIKDKEYRDEIFNRNHSNDFKEEKREVDEKNDAENVEKEILDERKSEIDGNSAGEFAEDEKKENKWRIKCDALGEELTSLRARYDELARITEANKAANSRESTSDSLISTEKDETIAELNSKIENYAAAVKKARERIEAQEIELNRVRSNENSNENELARIREESEGKTLEILGIQSEFKSCKGTVNDLREKLAEESKKIDEITREKRFIVSTLSEYRKTICALRKDCQDVKSVVIDCGEARNDEFFRIKHVFEDSLRKNLEILARNESEKITLLENKLETSLRDKEILELELKERDSQISLMKDKMERFNDCDRRNSKLLAEIDNLNFVAFDLEKLKVKNEELRRELSINSLESTKLKEESENWEKKLIESFAKYETLRSENLELKKLNEETREKVVEECEEKCRNIVLERKEIIEKLEEEIKKLREKHESEIKILENNDNFAKTNYSKLQKELENRENDYTKKLNFFEAECAKRDDGLERLRVEMEKREKMLENLIEKSNNFDAEISKISEEKLSLVSQLENREKLLENEIEKSNKFQTELTKISEEKLHLVSELQNQEKILKNEIEKSNKFEEELTKISEEKLRFVSELQNQEKILEKEIEKLNKCKAELSRLSEENLKLDESLKESNNATIRNEELIASLKETINSQNILLNELKATNNKISTESSSLKEKIALLEKSAEKMCEEKAELIASKAGIEEKIKKNDEELRGEVKRLNVEIDGSKKLCKDLEEVIEDSRRREEELRIEVASLAEEIKKRDEKSTSEEEDPLKNSNRLMIDSLRSELQERESKLLNWETKGSQIELLNEELRSEIERLKRQSETNEEEQSMRLKQLVKEFQAQLHDKDEELQAALDKRFESQQNYESDLVQQYREQLKDFQVELTTKSEEIENLLLEKKEAKLSRDREIEKSIETMERMKQEHANELRESERKWKTTLKQRSDQLEAKHEEEVGELAREWRNERRNSVEKKRDETSQELESTSRVAMAAVQSNTGSLHTLQQTMLSQRRELAELRKLVKLRHDTLEDSTEIEYLRNILYEYMMGRETVVLARVIAAVVKFDQEQTSKILKKEEDKLTLLGSLGLS